jgi:Rrf2 family protein
MIDIPDGKTIGIKRIAELHGITETYLSKIFAKLGRAQIVKSIPGVKGGYALARNAEDISFWDIIEAIEGPAYLFQCAEIRKKNIFVDDPSVFSDKCPCLIKVVIQEAEDAFRNSLRTKSLRWLYDHVRGGFPDAKKQAMADWINSV